MIRHLQAMKARSEARGFSTYLIDATGARGYPRVTLSPAYARLGEVPVCGLTEALDEDVRVTVAGLSAESVMGVLGALRDLFSPGRGWTPLDVAGRRAEVRWLRHELTEVDRDVTVTGSNVHPIFAVDAYRIVSEPINGGA